jgi:outer membrane protein assembly factor BamB
MRTPLRVVLAACLGALFVCAARAGDWPGWRGPTGVGYSDEKELPLTWDGETKENVLWSVELEGKGYSSPIVWRGRLYVTGAKHDRTTSDVPQIPQHYVACYEATTGKKLWSAAVPPGSWPKEKPEMYAVPTPATDGQRVYAWFGSSHHAVMVAVNLDGNVVWSKEFPGPHSLNPVMGSSPVLFGDTVIQLCDQGRGKGFLMALDRKTGEERWRQARAAESFDSATPVLIDVKGKLQLVINASSGLQGLDPADGKLIWKCAGAVGFGASPAYGSGLVYAEGGNGSGPGLCVDPTGEGDVTGTKLKWQLPRAGEGYGSPIVVGDYVYRAQKPDIVKCWSLKTGEALFSERLRWVPYLSSPFSTADGRIYFASGQKTYVIKAGPRLELLAKNDAAFGDDGPSAAVSGGRIFLKSTTRLMCVGKK